MLSFADYLTAAKAAEYAQRLKKKKDKAAVGIWGDETLTRIQPTKSLREIIQTEIAKLSSQGGKNATA